MKITIILFSTLLLTFTCHATNCHKEGGHSHDEVTTNGLSSGEITDNIININVNGMVCDFCAQSIEKVFMKRGGRVIILLGLLTIFSAVNFHNFLHLPPMLGMMFGLGLLGLYSFYLKITHDPKVDDTKFDFFKKVSKAEWDTLLFFFGVILSVGGLGFIGYLSLVSEILYDGMGATIANSIVGILSAVVDNIPVMFAVITMKPEMSTDQWLLVTLTTGVGGSLLSIGSAAGVHFK
jgi:Na+/H+ antiporter NhaD/arsenite permease-like protein